MEKQFVIVWWETIGEAVLIALQKCNCAASKQTWFRWLATEKKECLWSWLGKPQVQPLDQGVAVLNCAILQRQMVKLDRRNSACIMSLDIKNSWSVAATKAVKFIHKNFLCSCSLPVDDFEWIFQHSREELGGLLRIVAWRRIFNDFFIALSKKCQQLVSTINLYSLRKTDSSLRLGLWKYSDRSF